VTDGKQNALPPGIDHCARSNCRMRHCTSVSGSVACGVTERVSSVSGSPRAELCSRVQLGILFTFGMLFLLLIER
jgi:hypothetical protein